ncbi:MAG: 9-O-acetylesterase [Chitinivibrionia bacterium]|nr:9-O-acetylesterase [Chitinivibrionia bacterium]
MSSLSGSWSGLVAAVSLLFAGALTGSAEVKLPKIFGSNMVLQRDAPIAVWGWAAPNEAVSVAVGDAKADAKATAKGEWRLDLPAMKAGGPLKMTVKGSNEVVFDNVMVGAVWLCSGQSNMEMGIKACTDADTEIPAANNPAIRLFKVPKKFTQAPQNDVDAVWKVCTPETVAEGGWGGFSGAGYYFGKELNKALNVPVGLIDASWGGTRIEPWTPPAGFAKIPALASVYELVQIMDPGTDLHKQRLEKVLNDVGAWTEQAKKSIVEKTAAPILPKYPDELLPPKDQQVPATLYNGMLHPIVPFGIRGAIWYQGESNHGEGMLYTEKTKALVNGWREVWKNPKLQYFFVQIAPFYYGEENPNVVAEFWEAQAAVVPAVPDTGMIVTTDISDLKDIHPKNKKEVGRRLSLLALAKTYGKDVVCVGPSFKSMSVEGAKVRLTMDGVGGGLASRDGKPLDWFEMIDQDEGGFVKADAAIDGASIVLSAPSVKKPAAVRFAWSKIAEPNLMNKEGLPGVPFRAGEVPKRDQLVMVPEAKDYQLVYDLDLSKLGAAITYDVDNRAKINKPFDRVAYILELEAQGGQPQYVYASMDAFTDDLGKLGVPTVASGANFQQKVNNLTVFSNVQGIVTGGGLKGGNIEFWPNNYGPQNSKGIPNATNDGYDFGDQPSDPADGYGSMQIHNFEAKQILFAINSWKSGPQADIGIGNRKDDKNADWTFAKNGSSYAKKRLRVLVHLK